MCWLTAKNYSSNKSLNSYSLIFSHERATCSSFESKNFLSQICVQTSKNRVVEGNKMVILNVGLKP